MRRELPKIIREVGFDFRWDEHKVWQLDLPTEEMPIDKLAWHFDVPFLWSKPNGYYDIKPREVIDSPRNYSEEYARTMQADISYPIDVMLWRGRWVILDGLHRLMKQYIEGNEAVDVRKVPKSLITLIEK